MWIAGQVEQFLQEKMCGTIKEMMNKLVYADAMFQERLFAASQVRYAKIPETTPAKATAKPMALSWMVMIFGSPGSKG